MKCVSVVGLGYIGLPTAILAAQKGYKVFGFDVDKEKIAKINSGDPTIIEPEISQRLSLVIKNKEFVAYNTLQRADVFVIAVPTPLKKKAGSLSDKKSDLSYVESAFESISHVLSPGNLVILESTVPVGTTLRFARYLEKQTGLVLGIDFFVAHCPERVLPGKIFEELVSNDRVLGGICQTSSRLSKQFYSKFVKGKLHLTDDKTAEMVKLIENSSRDVQIAFANQVADMCYQVGIDPFNVIAYANKHPRVNILNPGCGVGGHCIAVDPWFLVENFEDYSHVIRVSRIVNDGRPSKIVDDVLKKAERMSLEQGRKARVFALGLTFKPNVDDLRESPALKICNELNKKNKYLDISVCEPNILSDNIKEMGFDNVQNLLDGILWSDIIVCLVKHNAFTAIKHHDLKNKIIVDTCGLLYTSKERDIDGAIFDKTDKIDTHKDVYKQEQKTVGG